MKPWGKAGEREKEKLPGGLVRMYTIKTLRGTCHKRQKYTQKLYRPPSVDTRERCPDFRGIIIIHTSIWDKEKCPD